MSALQEAIRVESRPGFIFIPILLIPALIAVVLLPPDVARDTCTRLFIALFIIIAVIDVLTMKVPNLIIYPAIAFALAATSVVDAELLPRALLGGIILLGIMFIIALSSRGAMGMGDAKFAALSGCALGLKHGIFSLLFGFSIGAIFALVLLLLRLRERRDLLPLTPFLAIGSVGSGLVYGFLLRANA